jgi:hypothetical protein
LLLLEELLSRPSQRRLDTKKLKSVKLNPLKKVYAGVEYWKHWKEVEVKQLARTFRPTEAAAAAIATANAVVAGACSDAQWSWKGKLPWHQDGNEGMR